MPSGSVTPKDALDAILARIEAARKAAVAPAPSVKLIAISKIHGPEAIRPLLEAGQRAFGENRVQEAHAKWPALTHDYPEVELHLVGPLQTNKAAEAVALFDFVHSLDRPKLAHALAAEMEKRGKRPTLFVQVNTGAEAQKAGVAPQDAPGLIALAREQLKLPVRGLMCIPPQSENPAPHFALLAKIAREQDLPFLSMGMSADFEIAIKFGATHVRVGSALFGARDYGPVAVRPKDLA